MLKKINFLLLRGDGKTRNTFPEQNDLRPDTAHIPNNVFVNFEPNRNDRFIVNFPESIGIPAFCVKSISNMTFNQESSLNRTNQQIFINVYDILRPFRMSSRIWNLHHTGELYEDIRITIDILDPIGAISTQWIVQGNISGTNYPPLDYSDGGLSLIELQMDVRSVLMNGFI